MSNENTENSPKCDQDITKDLQDLDLSITEEEIPICIDGAPMPQSPNQNAESVSEHKHEHENCPYQNIVKDVESCQSSISLLQQENKDLQEKLNLLIGISKEMKNENEKLLSTAAANNKENMTLKAKLETAAITSKKYEAEIKSLKVKKSEENTRSLMLEEENKKLNFSLDEVSKEKATVLGQMLDTTGLADTKEMKIENEVQDLKDGMKDFKDTVFDAIRALNNQVEKIHDCLKIMPKSGQYGSSPKC